MIKLKQLLSEISGSLGAIASFLLLRSSYWTSVQEYQHKLFITKLELQERCLQVNKKALLIFLNYFLPVSLL